MISSVPDTYLMNPLGDTIGEGITSAVTSGIDAVMEALWTGCLWLLRSAFELMDSISTFTVDPHSGSIGPVWSTMVWLSGAIALGLFFWQLSTAVLRGGRGMARAATGPVSYGVALAVTAGVVGLLVQGADGLTTLLLEHGLRAENFSAAFHTTTLGQGVANGVKAVALGLIGFFGLLPAGLGYTLEIIWRQAAILVLVATVPITAAGLLAQSTASWYWRTARWTIAAVMVKPALALVLVIGFSVLAQTSGPTGVLAGVGVLWVSLVAPLALYRLLAFIDPGTDAGGAFRQHLGSALNRLGGNVGSSLMGDHDGYAGFGNSPGGGGSSSSGGGGIGSLESANTARFDSAPAAPEMAADNGAPPPAPQSTPAAYPADAGNASTTAAPSEPGPVDAQSGQAGPAQARAAGLGGEGGAAAGAAETAVIL